MKRLIVQINVIVHHVIFWISSSFDVVIVFVMMIQIMRNKLAMTVHFSRNGQMRFMETVWKYSWNSSRVDEKRKKMKLEKNTE